MLNIFRTVGERVRINNEIELEIKAIENGSVQLTIHAPEEFLTRGDGEAVAEVNMLVEEIAAA